MYSLWDVDVDVDVEGVLVGGSRLADSQIDVGGIVLTGFLLGQKFIV